MFAVIHRESERSRPGLFAFFNTTTPDRTKAILSGGPSPLPDLLESLRVLKRLGAEVAGVACNTVHYWLGRWPAATGTRVRLPLPVVSMIDETVERTRRVGISTVGLLATTGTVTTQIYQSACQSNGVRCLCLEGRACVKGPATRISRAEYARLGVGANGCVPRSTADGIVQYLTKQLGEQEGLLMEAVYGEYGVKSGFSGALASLLVRRAAERLVDRGAQAIILGCTELPLILPGKSVRIAKSYIPLIDSNQALADALRARQDAGARIGVAGGMGPASTIDLLTRVGVASEATRLMTMVYQRTIKELRTSGRSSVDDQDHLNYIFVDIPACDAENAQLARRLVGVGIDFICFTDHLPVPADTFGGLDVEHDVARIVTRGLRQEAKDA